MATSTKEKLVRFFSFSRGVKRSDEHIRRDIKEVLHSVNDGAIYGYRSGGDASVTALRVANAEDTQILLSVATSDGYCTVDLEEGEYPVDFRRSQLIKGGRMK